MLAEHGLPPHDRTIDPERGGILLVDKPLTWTSFDVVGKLRGALRRMAGRKLKVGHGGTLDPLATGLLIVAYGPFTKRLPLLTGLDKTYTCTLVLGQVTDSYDLESEVREGGPWEHLDAAAIQEAVARFEGAFMQRPPVFSAKRFQGERAYHLARRNEMVRMEPVPVLVHRLAVTAIRGREVDLEAEVGKGTYIRSLAHDIGEALGCGAHISALRRTAIGPYQVADALPPDVWAEQIAPRA